MSRKRMKLLSFRKVSRKDWLRYPGRRKVIGRYFDCRLDSYTYPLYYISVCDLYRYKHAMELLRLFKRLSKTKEGRNKLTEKMKLITMKFLPYGIW